MLQKLNIKITLQWSVVFQSYVPSSLANNPLGSLFQYSIIFQSAFFLFA